jgi:peroxiredoxin
MGRSILVMSVPKLNTQAPSFDVKPVFGVPLSVSEDSQSQPLVLVFVPSLGSAVARSLLAQVQEWVAPFDLAGVRLLAFTRSSARAAQDFVPRYHLRFPLVADPDGVFFSQYGVGVLRPKQFVSSLRPGAIKEGLQALRFGIGVPEKALFSPPAAFSIAQGGVISHVHIGPNLWSSLPLETLLAKAQG